jgi:hypothetical protein
MYKRRASNLAIAFLYCVARLLRVLAHWLGHYLTVKCNNDNILVECRQCWMYWQICPLANKTMSEETPPTKTKLFPVRYRNVRSSDYRVVPVNSALMHISSQDTIMVDLVLEHLPSAPETISRVDGDLWLPEVADPPIDEIVALREVQVGLVMSAAAARWIASALTLKADEIERQHNAATLDLLDSYVSKANE